MGENEKKELDELTLEELREKARLLADATGRDEDDILVDLLDDGVLNSSNTSNNKDLVEQLKEAAELISTVQNISKDISKNTVLNGGENSTNVNVETTFEGDVVDRAIESIQRKSENVKKLIITLIPIFLLITGGGLEAFGVIDMVENGEQDFVSYGACLDLDAENYDPFASWDDGSCDFGVPYCDTEWQYDDYSSSNENSVFVRFTFFDDNHCGVELEGHFKIILFKDNFSHDDNYIDAGVFTNDIEIQSDFNELDEGNYEYEIEFHTIECDDGTCEHGDEFNSPHKPNFIIEAEVILGCMDETANNYYELATQDDGSCEYDPEIIEGCTNSTATNYNENATVDDDSCEYPPPRCEIVLYEILMQYNNNTSWVQYDLDCGTEPNDQDGYNVSVQFWMSQNNTSLNYTIGYHYIKGYIADTQELCLEDITAGKYDFHWIAIWIDDDGEQKLLEVNWSDIEITG